MPAIVGRRTLAGDGLTSREIDVRVSRLGASSRCFPLLINFAAMRDPRDCDEFRSVVYDVQDPPVADPGALLILLYPFSFLHPDDRGLSANARILRSMRLNTVSSSASNSFAPSA